MTNKPQVGKVETLGVGGLSSFVLLIVNEYFNDSELLTIIQAAVPFLVSVAVYSILYLFAHFGIDDLNTYSAKVKLRSKIKEIKSTLREATDRGADQEYINSLNQQLNETEQALIELSGPQAPQISKVE